MKTLWLAANLTGYEWLKTARCLKEIDITDIITLSNNARTIMYDNIDRKSWYEFGINVHEVERTDDESNLIRRINPECIVVGGWRQLIGKEILDLAQKGVIGFHPTLLPKGRGPSPIINSIMLGIKESGLTMFYYDKNLDAGDIIAQEKFVIEDDDYSWDVYKKEIESGKNLININLPLIANGEAPRIPQLSIGETSYFEKRDPKTFNNLDLEKEDTDYLYKKIRALSKYGKGERGRLSYFGAWILLNEERIKIWKARPVLFREHKNKIILGEVIQTPQGTLLKTKDGALLLEIIEYGGIEFREEELGKLNNLEDILKSKK